MGTFGVTKNSELRVVVFYKPQFLKSVITKSVSRFQLHKVSAHDKYFGTQGSNITVI